MKKLTNLRTAHDVGRTNDHCYTPAYFFDALKLQFDLDVCAPIGGALHVPALAYYSTNENGLMQPWYGKVFMNPPYSEPAPWVERFIEHGNGVALLPTTNGKWQLDLWYADTAWAICPPVKFVGANGEPYKTALPSRLWLVAMGQECQDALARFGKTRR